MKIIKPILKDIPKIQNLLTPFVLEGIILKRDNDEVATNIRSYVAIKKDDKFIIGLPGFAYSSTVTFALYVLPLIFKFRGGSERLNIKDAIIEHDFPKKTKKTVFTASDFKYQNRQYFIDITNKKQGTSAILTYMLGNIALLIQDDDSTDLKAGDKVKILKI